MSPFALGRWIRRAGSVLPAAVPKTGSRRARPGLERLEDRLAPATLTVVESRLNATINQYDHVWFIGGGENGDPQTHPINLTAAGTANKFLGGNISSVQHRGTIDHDSIDYRVEMDIDSYASHQARNIQQSFTVSGVWTLRIDKQAGEEDGQRVEVRFSRGTGTDAAVPLSYQLIPAQGSSTSGSVTGATSLLARIGDTVKFTFASSGSQSSTVKTEQKYFARSISLVKPTVTNLADPLATDPDTGLDFNSARNEVKVTYTVGAPSLERNAQISFEWLSVAKVPLTAHPISYRFGIDTAAEKTAGTHTSPPFSASLLGERPADAVFLRMRLDPDDQVPGDKDENNFADADLSQPVMVASFLAWDQAAGRLNFGYQVVNPINRNVTIRFDWIDASGAVRGKAYTQILYWYQLVGWGGITVRSVPLTSLAAPPANTVALRMTVDASNPVASSLGRTTERPLFQVTPALTANYDTPDDDVLGDYLQGVPLKVAFTARLTGAVAGVGRLPLSAAFLVGSSPPAVAGKLNGAWTFARDIADVTPGRTLKVQMKWGGAVVGEREMPFQFDSDGKVDAVVQAIVPKVGWRPLADVRYLAGVNHAGALGFLLTLGGNAKWYTGVVKQVEVAGATFATTAFPGGRTFSIPTLGTLPAGRHAVKVQFATAGGTASFDTPDQKLNVLAVPDWLKGGRIGYYRTLGTYSIPLNWSVGLLDTVNSLTGGTVPTWMAPLSGLATTLALNTNFQASVPLLLTSQPTFKVSSASLTGTVMGVSVASYSLAATLFRPIGTLDAPTLMPNGLGIALVAPQSRTWTLLDRHLPIPIARTSVFDTTLTLKLLWTASVQLSELQLVLKADNGQVGWDPTLSHFKLTAGSTWKPGVEVTASALLGLVSGTLATGGEVTTSFHLGGKIGGALLDPVLSGETLDATLRGSFWYRFKLKLLGGTIEDVDTSKTPETFGPVTLF